MNDASKYSTGDLVVRLHWPSDQSVVAGEQRVVAELQFVDGLALASMTVPVEQLLQAIAQKLECYALISPDGFVSVVLDRFSEALPKDHLVALDQLVADAISPDMLEDEPDAPRMLGEFRTRLLKSLEHVEKAIAALPKP
jgi:hypothetical protein